MLVEITRAEKRKLIQLGTDRNACKHPSWTRRKADYFDDRQVDILGCCGEFAAAKALGSPMDWDVHSHGDDGTDLTTPFGSVAVKFNHRTNGFLMVEERDPDPWGDLTADFILLVHGSCRGKGDCTCAEEMNSEEPRVLNVRGWLPASVFKKHAVYNDWNLGGRFCVSVEHLYPVSHFDWINLNLEIALG